MALNAEWGRRLRDAKREYEHRHDTRLAYREIGEQVAKLVKRDKPFGTSTARDWFEIGQEPESFAVAEALAVVLEVADVGVLVFGAKPRTDTPALPETVVARPHYGVEASEYFRLEREKAEREAAEEAARNPKRRKNQG